MINEHIMLLNDLKEEYTLPYWMWDNIEHNMKHDRTYEGLRYGSTNIKLYFFWECLDRVTRDQIYFTVEECIKIREADGKTIEVLLMVREALIYALSRLRRRCEIELHLYHPDDVGEEIWR